MKHSLLFFWFYDGIILNILYFWWNFVSKILKNWLVNIEWTRMLSPTDSKGAIKEEEGLKLNDFNPQRDVKFLLYTRFNPEEPQYIIYNDRDSIKNSYFNPNKPTRILIHGWIDNAQGMLGTLGRKAYLQKGEFNVISVDWSAGADTPNYFRARSLVTPVGRFLAEFIEFLSTEKLAQPSQVYLIGHSLGAHIAGIVGKNLTSGRLDTIFGLDPAGPMFFVFQPESRLDVTDAKYVEVIHTSYQGFGKPIGYADFMVNNAKIQPGCNVLLACSHLRSIAYWAESINTEVGFWATPEDDIEMLDDQMFDIKRSTVLMGGEPSNQCKARGVYKVETNSSSPYAKGPIKDFPVESILEEEQRITFL